MSRHSDILPPSPYDRVRPRVVLPAGYTLLTDNDHSPTHTRVTFNEPRYLIYYGTGYPENYPEAMNNPVSQWWALHDPQTNIDYLWCPDIAGLPPY